MVTALGCRTGYFAIEQLAYDHADTIAWLETSDQGLRDQGGDLVAELTWAFGLQPWSDVAGRLSDLETRLLPTVHIGPGAF